MQVNRPRETNIVYLSANGFPKTEEDAKGVFSLEHACALMAEGAVVDAVDMSADEFTNDIIGDLPIRRVPRLRTILKEVSLRKLVRYVKTFLTISRSVRGKWVVFSFFYGKYLPLLILFKLCGAKILIIAHGGDVMRKNALDTLCKFAMFRVSDLVTPVSEYTETLLSCLIRRRNVDNKKILVIPNGVDLEKLLPVKCSRANIRAELGIGETDFLVLSVCNLVKRKGIEEVIQGVVKLLRQGELVHHIIIGSGPELTNLKRACEQSGSPECFHFVPRVKAADLSSYYNAADVFVMMSVTDWDQQQTEGFGITYLEAMAMGTPVIGGARSGASTPVKSGFNGILIDPYSVTVSEEIAEEMQRMKSDTSMYRKLSENARHHAAGSFSWRKNAAATLSAMREIDSVVQARCNP